MTPKISDARQRAEALFKQPTHGAAGPLPSPALSDYRAAEVAVGERTDRLKAQRLLRERQSLADRRRPKA